jgi:hypothetical protein
MPMFIHWWGKWVRSVKLKHEYLKARNELFVLHKWLLPEDLGNEDCDTALARLQEDFIARGLSREEIELIHKHHSSIRVE